jgi:TPR repeat protein
MSFPIRGLHFSQCALPFTHLTLKIFPLNQHINFIVNEYTKGKNDKVGKDLKDASQKALDVSASIPEKQRAKIQALPDLHKLLTQLRDHIAISVTQISQFQTDDKVSTQTMLLYGALNKAHSLLLQIASPVSVFTSQNRKFKGPVFDAFQELSEYSGTLFISLAEATSKSTALAAAAAQRNVAQILLKQTARNSEDASTLQKAENMCIEADRYFFGHGVKQSKDTALSLYLEAAQLGHVRSMLSLGSMYCKGDGCEISRSKGLLWYQTAAELGDADGLHALAVEMLEDVKKSNYNGVDRKSKLSEKESRIIGEAVEHLKLAVDMDHAEAMVSLGQLYESGWPGVSSNLREAASLYGLAAELGSAKGQNKYGYMLYTGRGCDADFREAALWFKKACAQGESNAWNNLGLCYEIGRGVPRDLGEATACYTKASDMGHSSGHNNLAYMLIKEVVALGPKAAESKVKLNRAIRLLHSAAEKEVVDAYYHLGTIYEHGLHMGTTDTPLAISYYKKAADSTKGHAKAAYRLASIFSLDPKTKTSQIHYLKAAANKSHSDAQFKLARMIEGDDVPGESAEEAVKLYRLAAASGNLEALFKLGQLYYSGKLVDVNLEQAEACFKDALAGGYAPAEKALSQINKTKHAGNVSADRE